MDCWLLCWNRVRQKCFADIISIGYKACKALLEIFCHKSVPFIFFMYSHVTLRKVLKKRLRHFEMSFYGSQWISFILNQRLDLVKNVYLLCYCSFAADVLADLVNFINCILAACALVKEKSSHSVFSSCKFKSQRFIFHYSYQLKKQKMC